MYRTISACTTLRKALLAPYVESLTVKRDNRRLFASVARRSPSYRPTAHISQLHLARHSRSWFHHSASSLGLKPFLLADIGEGITECEVIQWFVEPGSNVEEFDKICEVQSDKASVEITSRYTGKISKLYYNVNEIAKVGQPLVDIEVADDAQDTQKTGTVQPATETTASSPPPHTPQVKNNAMSTFLTPAVRRLCSEHKINVTDIRGTGKGGRVLKGDVLAYLSGKASRAPTVESATPTPSPPPSPRSVATTANSEPLTGIQRAMFKSMTKSLSIPQLGYMDEMELNATSEYRDTLNKHIASSNGLYAFNKISFLPIFAKCLSLALTAHPIMNATLVGNPDDIASMRIAYRASHNIGIAMDTPQGLIVPNIKDVQSKTILDVATEIHRLTQQARAGSLTPADLQGGTITISNIGTIDGSYTKPVIVSSELAIVALGKMETQPRYNEAGQVVSRQILPFSWSADHRIIDGATIARFGNYWKTLVENPAVFAGMLR